MSTAIEFNNISKLYRLGLVSTGTLAHDLKRWWTTSVRGNEDPYLKIGETNDRSTKGGSDYVWALKDIDFKVEQGDVVGIIGKNGAGKSTLLKILSKVTAPTTGTIKARGRIGSLLEVGTGFHPEMTGRENIYLNGAILGMTKPEIARKLDEIVDFSGCERYIDTPVKRYSSGMMVRLGFAVAAHLDPEILVVDEVLAVGDAEFQKKAIGKMQDVSKGEGRTVLFVSHNMASVRKLCNRGILLENGSIKFQGSIADTIDNYLTTHLDESTVELRNRVNRQGTQEAHIVEILMTFGGIPCSSITMGKGAEFTITVESENDIDDTYIGLSIWNQYETIVIHTNTSITQEQLQRVHKGVNKYKCSFPSLPLQYGGYYLNLALYHKDGKYIDQIEKGFIFTVVEDNCYGTGKLAGQHQGCLAINHQWSIEQ